MDVVGLPEFDRCIRSAITADRDVTRMDRFLDRLSNGHTTSEMRDSRLLIPGTEIDLWATCGVRLSSGSYRAVWRYEARDGQRVIVCFTLAGML